MEALLDRGLISRLASPDRGLFEPGAFFAGGRLVVPVGGPGGQRLEIVVRSPEGPAVRRSVPCRFVPLLGEEGY